MSNLSDEIQKLCEAIEESFEELNAVIDSIIDSIGSQLAASDDAEKEFAATSAEG